jgi:hypothetical protein
VLKTRLAILLGYSVSLLGSFYFSTEFSLGSFVVFQPMGIEGIKISVANEAQPINVVRPSGLNTFQALIVSHSAGILVCHERVLRA